MSLCQPQVLVWLEKCASLFDQQRDFLTDLDRAIGDADHGLNMQRGFGKVREKLPSLADSDIGTILKTTGMTLLSQVGGASGPLFGTFFIKAAQPALGKNEVSFDEVVQMFNAGVEGIAARGRAELGDKTMYDVWHPISTLLETANQQGQSLEEAVEEAVKKAEFFVNQTIAMKAKKGRASYLNERSIGHQDPGATSVSFILQALLAALKGSN